jgi:putative glutamine amidotransferase
VDLGTANVLVYVKGKGIVIAEPSVVAVAQRDNSIVAVGGEAREMLGRTPGAIQVIRPMRDGVIADYLTTEAMLRYFVNKVVGRFNIIKPEVMICIPVGVTSVERRAVADAGAEPVLIPVGTTEDLLRDAFEQVDGLIFSGGGDVDPAFYGSHASAELRRVRPARDRSEITLVGWAVRTGKPFLGICRGLQVVNVALGGSLIQDIARERPDALKHDNQGMPRDHLAHRIALMSDSRLFACIGAHTFEVNSFHHQAVDQVAAPLQVSARSPDGLVEAVEIPEHPFGLAVQWHPERLPGRSESRSLFAALTAAARR